MELVALLDELDDQSVWTLRLEHRVTVGVYTTGNETGLCSLRANTARLGITQPPKLNDARAATGIMVSK